MEDLGYLIPILIGLIPATIAHGKGRSFFGFWVFGALLFIIALPWAVTMEMNEKELAERAERAATARGEIRCPACKEFMRGDATICPHCRTSVLPLAVTASPAELLAAG